MFIFISNWDDNSIVYVLMLKIWMSISTKLEQFRNNPRIVLNDKFIGDQGAG